VVVVTDREKAVETVEVPAYYADEIAEREQIARECPIKVYCSSINRRWGWPYKLNSSRERRMSARQSADSFIIDPGAYNPACSLEIGHAAWKTNADYVLARDIPPTHQHFGDLDDRHLRSVAVSQNYVAQNRAMREADSYTVGQWECAHNADPIVPIQPPFEESLAQMAETVEYPAPVEADDGTPLVDNSRTVKVNLLEDDIDYYAVGGLLSIPDVDERIEALQFVRDELGSAVKIHALAPGTDPEMIRALRQHTDLVDSIDVSTPETAPSKGKVPDRGWHQHKANVSGGEDSTTTRGAEAARIAVELARQLTPGKFDEYEYETLAAPSPDLSSYS
jgi:hypothetical protein